MSGPMSEHARASELLTWLVNGRLEAADSRWLDEHLADCAVCRHELAAQRRVRDAIAREPTVEFAPQASFNRLWKRIEIDAIEPAPRAPSAAATGLARTRSPCWMRAVFAAQAAVILVLFGVLWERPDPGAYRTVTDSAPAPAAAEPVVKAIFADQVRLADVKEILAGAGLVVAAGPSEAGVYTLVARDARSAVITPATLARLRADPRVRFAEADAR